MSHLLLWYIRSVIMVEALTTAAKRMIPIMAPTNAPTGPASQVLIVGPA